MGMCMKDHPPEDVRKKLKDVEDSLNPTMVKDIENGVAINKWEQESLNELFHALREIEKQESTVGTEKAVYELSTFLVG